MAFDAPQERDKSYMERWDYLQRGITTDHPIVSLVKPTLCNSRQHFNDYFKQSSSNGIILRNPTAWYFEKNSFFKKQVQLSV
jgi:hypothetical protein